MPPPPPGLELEGSLQLGSHGAGWQWEDRKTDPVCLWGVLPQVHGQPERTTRRTARVCQSEGPQLWDGAFPGLTFPVTRPLGDPAHSAWTALGEEGSHVLQPAACWTRRPGWRRGGRPDARAAGGCERTSCSARPARSLRRRLEQGAGAAGRCQAGGQEPPSPSRLAAPPAPPRPAALPLRDAIGGPARAGGARRPRPFPARRARGKVARPPAPGTAPQLRGGRAGGAPRAPRTRPRPPPGRPASTHRAAGNVWCPCRRRLGERGGPRRGRPSPGGGSRRRRGGGGARRPRRGELLQKSPNNVNYLCCAPPPRARARAPAARARAPLRSLRRGRGGCGGPATGADSAQRRRPTRRPRPSRPPPARAPPRAPAARPPSCERASAVQTCKFASARGSREPRGGGEAGAARGREQNSLPDLPKKRKRKSHPGGGGDRDWGARRGRAIVCADTQSGP